MRPTDLPKLFDETVVEAMLELFEAYGLDANVGYVDQEITRHPLLSAAVAFGGSGLRGSLLLMASRQSISTMHQVVWDEPRLRDWIGELANQALGCIRRKQGARGIETAMSLPAVLASVSLDFRSVDQRYTKIHAFRTSRGTFVVCLEIVQVSTPDDASLVPGNGEESEQVVLF